MFLDRISRSSRWEEGVWFRSPRLSSLLFADDVVLSASSSRERLLAMGWWASQWGHGSQLEMGGVPALGWEWVTAPSGEVQESRSLDHKRGESGSEDRPTTKAEASAALWILYWSAAVKRKLSVKAICAPTLIYGHKLWVVTKRLRLQRHAMEMSFLWWVSGLSLSHLGATQEQSRYSSKITRN